MSLLRHTKVLDNTTNPTRVGRNGRSRCRRTKHRPAISHIFARPLIRKSRKRRSDFSAAKVKESFIPAKAGIQFRISEVKWIPAFAGMTRGGAPTALRRHPMLVIRPLAVIEDRVERVEIVRIGIEPGVDIGGLDRDDAAIMSRGGYFCGRLVGDRRK